MKRARAEETIPAEAEAEAESATTTTTMPPTPPMPPSVAAVWELAKNPIALADVRRAIALIDGSICPRMYMAMYTFFFNFGSALTPALVHGAWHALVVRSMVHSGATLRTVHGMFSYPLRYFRNHYPTFSPRLALEPMRRRRLLLLARTLAPFEPRLPALLVVRLAYETTRLESDPSRRHASQASATWTSVYAAPYMVWTWSDAYAAYANLLEPRLDRDAWLVAYRACECECECEHVVDGVGRELTRDELHADWRRT